MTEKDCESRQAIMEDTDEISSSFAKSLTVPTFNGEHPNNILRHHSPEPLEEYLISELENEDAWYIFKKENPGWRESLTAELQPRANELNHAVKQECQTVYESLRRSSIGLLTQLSVMSYSIVRLDASSKLPQSTRNFLHVMVVLLSRFQSSIYGTYIEIDETFLRGFYEEIQANKSRDRNFDWHSLDPPATLKSAKLDGLLEVLFGTFSAVSKSLKIFSERMDSKGSAPMESVQNLLLLASTSFQLWSSSGVIDEHEPVPIYKVDLMIQLNKYMERLAEGLDELNRSDLPRYDAHFWDQKKRKETESLALLSVATFFSLITTSTLGFTFQHDESLLYDLVNFFWFTSLAFSIASVMNSLLAFTWKHTIFEKRPDGEQLPYLIKLWTCQSPILFLVISALTFTIGLCVFAYASGQTRWTATITAVLTGVSTIGIFVITAWFAWDFYVRQETSLTKTLSLFFSKTRTRVPKVPSIGRLFRQVLRKICLRRRKSDQSTETQLPVYDARKDKRQSATRKQSRASWMEKLSNTLISDLTFDSEEDMEEKQIEDIDDLQSEDQSIVQRIQSALATIRPRKLKVNDGVEYSRSPIQPSFSHDGTLLAITTSSRCSIYRVRDLALIQTIMPTEKDEQYYGSVVWSPRSSGAFLLLSTSGLQIHHREEQNYVFHLTRKVNAHLERNHDDRYNFGWFKKEDAFWVITGVTVRKHDATRSENSANKHLGEGSLVKEDTAATAVAPQSNEVAINDVVFVGGEGGIDSRLLVSVTSSRMLKGEEPVASRMDEHALLVFNLEGQKVESRIPLFDQAQALSLSNDKKALLVRYGKKSPQLWRIGTVNQKGRLIVKACNTYTPLPPMDGDARMRHQPRCRKAFFCGPEDEFVAIMEPESKHCTFRMFDKETAVPLCSISNTDVLSEHIRWIRVNCSHPSLMFVTTTKQLDDDSVMIWSSSKSDDKENLSYAHRVKNSGEHVHFNDERSETKIDGTTIKARIRALSYNFFHS